MWQELNDRDLVQIGRRIRFYGTEYSIAAKGEYMVTLISENETWVLSIDVLLTRHGVQIRID